MSDLTADEARRASDWLGAHVFDATISRDALRRHADEMDPPESVESLREALLGEHDARERTEQALAEVNAELACLRVLMRAATTTPREHWLGGDHSNQPLWAGDE